MKTIEINLYKFSELSEQAKKNALNKLSDINIDYDWYQFTFEDCERIGIKIVEFDIYGRYIKGCLIINDLVDICNLIKKEHGEGCETYKTAINYLDQYDKLVAKHSKGLKGGEQVHEDNYDIFDEELKDLLFELRDDILQDYLNILRNEYEYRTSEEAIIETIEANDYDFTEDGKLY